MSRNAPPKEMAAHIRTTFFPKLANHSFGSIFENLAVGDLSNQMSFFIFTLHGGKVTTRRQWLSVGVYQNAVAKCPVVEKSSPNFHQMALNDFLAMSSVPKHDILVF